MEDLKEELLKKLRDDSGFVIELQRVLNIDDLEEKVDELDNLSKN